MATPGHKAVPCGPRLCPRSRPVSNYIRASKQDRLYLLEGEDWPELRTQISPRAAGNSRHRSVGSENSHVIRQRITAVKRLLKSKLHPWVQPVEQGNCVKRALVRASTVCSDVLRFGEVGVHDRIQAVIEVELPTGVVSLRIRVEPTRQRQT